VADTRTNPLGRPRLFLALRDYDRRKAAADLTAGITVGLVALPLAMAFAIASGLTPQAGLYTAVIAGGLISIFGGSRLQIGGPTGAFVVIVAGIVANHGVEGLFLCTVMAGVMLVVLGATGMGSAVRFIPRPVVVGFTNGIAVLIASTQIRDFFGLQIEALPGDFLPRMELLAERFWTWSPSATALSTGSLAIILVANRVSKRIPGTIVALLAGTIAVAALGLDVETIGTNSCGWPNRF
jgi:sulfate permease, SulP family